MNSVLEEIYSTILPSAPFVIAAYAILLAILFVYVFIIARKLTNAEKKMDALSEHVDKLQGKAE